MKILTDLFKGLVAVGMLALAWFYLDGSQGGDPLRFFATILVIVLAGGGLIAIIIGFVLEFITKALDIFFTRLIAYKNTMRQMERTGDDV